MQKYIVKVYKDRTEWFNEQDEYHRENGPAIEYTDGYKAWLLNDNYHREGAPAVIWSDGSQEWYLNGKLHREDGPAINYSCGTKRWYLNGEEFTEEEFNQIDKSSFEGKTVEINGKTYILKLK